MCMVPAGDLPLNISWLFNNITLNPARHSVAISQTNRVSTLTIDAVTYEHSGNYTCVASNAAGVSSHSDILKVNGQSTVQFSAILLLSFCRSSIEPKFICIAD
uniref:Ig-like domain-containing protein n=1 Tax=Cacopsylla melanoneura TaxID=428564 RepID=A0A8D8W495_9HEMI